MKKNNSLIRKFCVLSEALQWYGILLLLLFCYDSWNSCCLLSLAAIIPIKTYSNTEADKDQILSDNKNKSGIYMWTNLTNDKCYIGSAVDLPNRLSFYYSKLSMENLLKRSQSHICSALLKYGHYNFSLIILEYCEPDKCLEREGYYWKLFKPEYNIAQDPTAPFYGRTHSDASKTKISPSPHLGG